MNENLFHAVESYIENHTALTGPDAREAIRAIYQGETAALPEAATPEGEAIRVELQTALAHSSTPAPASPPAHGPVPASMDAAARRIVFRTAAGERLKAFADALAATSLPDAEALRAIEVAKADLPPSHPPVPSVEQRAAGLPEFGASHALPSETSGDRARAGWRRSFEKAEGRG